MNYPTHHPMELCSFGATMSHLSNNRFAMGFARGFDALYDIYGTPRANLKGLADLPELLRLLWNGKTFSGENSLGNFPYLYMNEAPKKAPPMLLGAMGPKTLALAGRHYDGVLLHPFLVDRAVADAAGIVRDAAETAEVTALFPDNWMKDSAALGNADHCARRINDQFDAGADVVLFHGSLPNQVSDLLEAYRQIRRSDYFDANDPWFEPSLPGTGI